MLGQMSCLVDLIAFKHTIHGIKTERFIRECEPVFTSHAIGSCIGILSAIQLLCIKCICIALKRNGFLSFGFLRCGCASRQQ